MRAFSLIIFSSLLACAPASVGRQEARSDPVVKTQASVDLGELRRLVNAEREKAGVASLGEDPALEAAARAHAEDMAAREYFSHDDPEGKSFVDRFRLAGVRFRAGAENIAWGQRSSSEVLRAWMASDGHRANLLNARYRRLGLGYAEGYWVQTFAD